MGNRVWHQAFFALLCSVLFLCADNIQAASLEKIEVASHLGEPFFAEVPLKLEANELASRVFVEIAAPADYKIFEVYRDPILKAIRADVASDARGVRVELSSRSRIQAPFFNLVLKIRYGRVSHFKKFSVFLDAPKAAQQVAEKAPQPSVEAVTQSSRTSLTESAGQAIVPTIAIPATTVQQPAKPYQGWARTDRYGPIVRGDSLSIVAERLRIDYRYTRNQIMLALFEKNRNGFEQGNMNLMKADSFLQVPTAADIELHSKAEAARVLTEHEKSWKKLTREPRYAAEAEAQRTRYTKRISIGEHADGVAAAPVAEAAAVTTAGVENSATTQPVSGDASPPATPADQSAGQPANTVAEASVDQSVQDETSQTLIRLQEQNEVLKQQLIGTQKSIETLTRKVEQDQAATAAKARIGKLEVMIAGLQSELQKLPRQQSTPVAAGMNWVIWLLGAMVVLLLGIVAMLMRREPAHPASSSDSNSEHADKSADVAEHPADKDETLEAVIENEVAEIETGETSTSVARETATIDSLPAFTDELSDTDTAELEPFDAGADVEPDADIDYVSEADVYIRYGMDDEAIKQLDMALRLQPDNVEAHIKKAELLLGKSDRQGFDETIAAATMTLAAIDLERFKSSIEKLGEDTEREDTDQTVADAGVQTRAPDVGISSQDTLALDASADDDLDFDLAGLDTISEEMTGELELPDIEPDQQLDESVQIADAAAGEPDDMPWLNDDLFDATASEGEDQPEAKAATELSSEKETVELPDFNMTGGATQELDNLLSEFSDQTIGEMAEADIDAGATMKLDHLLSEFEEDGDDELDFFSNRDVVESPVEQKINSQQDSDTMDTAGDVASDHGATQELDSLLSEFANDDELKDDEEHHKKS